ncbi:sensor histidine kinase [Flavobacterium sp.]|uniref:sensor histidine kinase n=1 Tax=Flavobacterium sp. TaxID=239 RepID=UPI0037528AEC
MKDNSQNYFLQSESNEVLASIFFTFLILAVVIILFFYFSRKKIIKKELEKKDLEINHQKELLKSIIITQEAERKRIAQDLHDDISSKLNVVSLNSHLLKTPNLSKVELIEITNNISNLTAKALENSRRIAHDLLPPVLEKFGIHAGIEELVVEFNSSKIVDVVYKNDIKFDISEIDRQLHIFRILQELLNNSVRHGKATEIKIEFKNDKGINTCFYSDNGIGFNVNSIDNMKGLGMKNIESRVTFLNGKFTIDSPKSGGINVIFTF